MVHGLAIRRIERDIYPALNELKQFLQLLVLTGLNTVVKYPAGAEQFCI